MNTGVRDSISVWFFFFNDTATAEIYTLSLHDALPICDGADHGGARVVVGQRCRGPVGLSGRRSEEHTSELQSRFDLVCRLLLEKKKSLRPRPESIVCHSPPCFTRPCRLCQHCRCSSNR